MPSIAVSASTSDQQKEAEKLAAKLHLPLAHVDQANDYDYLLLVTPRFIGLQKARERKSYFHIDFLSGKMQHRGKEASLNKELLAKAIGLKPKDNPLIIDATAGLGRDSFILAMLGFKVIMLERSPILFTLLQDALKRAGSSLQLIEADAITWLKESSITADVIYLDPMFPERKKSASVKKEMVLLQDLLGKDSDADQLLSVALTCAKRRVVVKRPRLAPSLTDLHPNFSLTGKSSRFDIYLISKK